jgi:hypothetical protein
MIRKYEFGVASNRITHIQNFIKIRLSVLKLKYTECRAKRRTWRSLHDLHQTQRTSIKVHNEASFAYKTSSALGGVPYCWIRDSWNLGERPQHLVPRGCCVAWAELHQSHCSPRTGTRPGAICMRLQYMKPEQITAFGNVCVNPFQSPPTAFFSPALPERKLFWWHFTFAVKKSQH